LPKPVLWPIYITFLQRWSSSERKKVPARGKKREESVSTMQKERRKCDWKQDKEEEKKRKSRSKRDKQESEGVAKVEKRFRRKRECSISKRKRDREEREGEIGVLY
jgi:flagellum-specific peptidoglycan hydrolase FlgJ